MRRLDSAVKMLYQAYDDKVPMRDFTGVTLEDLYRVETTFKTNVCLYKHELTDDGKTTAELVRRAHVHRRCTSNLSGRRVPLHADGIPTSG